MSQDVTATIEAMIREPEVDGLYCFLHRKSGDVRLMVELAPPDGVGPRGEMWFTSPTLGGALAEAAEAIAKRGG